MPLQKKSPRRTHNKSYASALSEPLTITISGNMAAALRFAAFTRGTSPEDVAEEAFVGSLLSDLSDGFRFTNDDQIQNWLEDTTRA